MGQPVRKPKLRLQELEVMEQDAWHLLGTYQGVQWRK
jgi:hypothetical protein